MSSREIREIKIDTWDEFQDLIKRKHYRKWIYRGQSNSEWKLQSSLYRSVSQAKSVREIANMRSSSINHRFNEKNMLDRFKSCAHLHLSHLPRSGDSLSWLALMQHHGAPTRLLDFSFSPYIALYFALESGNEDSAVYMLNHDAIRKVDDEHFGNSRKEIYKRVMYGDDYDDEICLFAFEPEFANQRLIAQQGLFVATNRVDYSHEAALEEYNLRKLDACKIIIPKALRYQGIRMLHQMNISSATIYPGLDGFCRSLYQLPVFDARLQRRVGNDL
ncbi:FRG domain-containing protein [Vibrio diabolicus]|uniref:FRG domain-containing protein n=1 Tax=Vibrio diabolicus TaxID=50719 RepID=UPI002160B694|nr:FRG domain-containing protein [Vibrio diabolicus]MCS0445089.1 FRG domain-containing protein [Vibrio diabolicus]